MMNIKQIKERIHSLKREIEILEEIVGTKNVGIGRPLGSYRFTDKQVKFLRDNKDYPMKHIIIKFNERFGTKYTKDSRDLYKFMDRQGIISPTRRLPYA